MKGYDKITKGWFSLTPCLNYNRHMMIITGQRSTGKSTGTAIYLLMDWLENKHGWIYTRRTKDETDLTCDTWFDNAADILRQRGHSLRVLIIQHSTFFMVQLSYLYITIGKTIALTIWTSVSKVKSLLFNTLSSFVIAFIPRSKGI